MLGIRKAITRDTEAQIEQLERRLESERRKNQEELDLMRKQLVRISRGVSLSEEALMRGQLHDDVPSGQLKTFLEGLNEPFVLDVRSAAEVASGKVPGALNIPIEQLGGRLSELPTDKSRPVVAYCAMGGRSAAACELLSQNGYLTLYNGGGVGSYQGTLER